MSRDFLALLQQARSDGRPLIWDGAVGTQLIARGLVGRVSEEWNLSRPDAIRAIHADYFAAGAIAGQTNTFGGNRLKLKTAGKRWTPLQLAAVSNQAEAVEALGHRLPEGLPADVGQAAAGETHQVHEQRVAPVAAVIAGREVDGHRPLCRVSQEVSLQRGRTDLDLDQAAPSSAVMGTPAYISPEQLAGQPPGTAWTVKSWVPSSPGGPVKRKRTRLPGSFSSTR